MWGPEDTRLTILWLTATISIIACALMLHTMIATLIT